MSRVRPRERMVLPPECRPDHRSEEVHDIDLGVELVAI
jgi:hypothetical protein